MKKIILIFLILLILIFSGCSSQNFSLGIDNSKTGKIQNDNTGNGLEISLDMNTESIKTKIIKPQISILNTGKYPITLSKNNFKIYTINKNKDGSNVITKDSLNNFYSRIFNSKNLTLYQNQKKENFGGKLIISDKYFNNVNNNKFDYVVKANYDYITDFSNNMLIDLNSNNKMQVYDLSQAAPIKITNIKLEDGFAKSEYDIIFTIKNNIQYSLKNPETKAKINNIELNFNQEPLINCLYLNYDKNKIDSSNIILNNKNSQITITCKINLAKYEKDNTPTNGIISGKITYNYEISSINTIDLPDRSFNNYN